LSAGDKAPFELILTSASIPVKEIDNYRLSIDWQKGGEAATTVIPSDFGSNNTVIGNENFVKKTELDAVHCGEKVTGTIKLTANLNCSNHGLIIENNTVLNMSGYTIKGSGKESSKVGLVWNLPVFQHYYFLFNATNLTASLTIVAFVNSICLLLPDHLSL
jgi:hypothetical protein